MIEDEKMPLGDMNWLELRRINDKLVKVMHLLALGKEKKINEWMLVSCKAEKGEEFQLQINTYIKNGWQPSGNIICTDYEGDQYYDQVMVKYDE